MCTLLSQVSSNKCQENVLGALCLLWHSKSHAMKWWVQVVNLLLFQYSFLLIMKSNTSPSAVSMTLGFNASLNLINDAWTHMSEFSLETLQEWYNGSSFIYSKNSLSQLMASSAWILKKEFHWMIMSSIHNHCYGLGTAKRLLYKLLKFRHLTITRKNIHTILIEREAR